eukprot:scaffold2182_cov198-Amphora_coffeaeformis.AAC.4
MDHCFSNHKNEQSFDSPPPNKKAKRSNDGATTTMSATATAMATAGTTLSVTPSPHHATAKEEDDDDEPSPTTNAKEANDIDPLESTAGRSIVSRHHEVVQIILPTISSPTPLTPIRAGSAKPQRLQSLGCNEMVRYRVHEVSREMFAKVKAFNFVRRPYGKGEYAHCVTPKEIQERNDTVYTAYKDVPTGSNAQVQDIGYTHDLSKCGRDPRLVHPIIRCETLSSTVDEALSDDWEAINDDLIQSNDTPYELQCLLTIIRDRGGLKRAKVYMCDEQVINARLDQVLQVVDATLHLFTDFVGCKVKAKCSWITGAKPERLSSHVPAIEYALDGFEWEDALKKPAVSNASTRAEIFCSDFSQQHKDEAIAGLERILVVQYNCQIAAYIFGEEAIIFAHVSARIVLHRPYCKAGGSLGYTLLQASILRGMGLEVVASYVAHVKGKPATTYKSGKPNAISACAIFEMGTRGYSLNKMITVTTFRDVLTQDIVRACEQNALAKTPNTIKYPSSRRARRAFRVANGADVVSLHLKDPKSKREMDTFVIEQANNFLSFTSSNTIQADVGMVHRIFALQGDEGTKKAKKETVFKRWENFFKNGHLNEPLLGLVKQHRKTQNKGNTTPWGVPLDKWEALQKEEGRFGHGKRRILPPTTC